MNKVWDHQKYFTAQNALNMDPKLTQAATNGRLLQVKVDFPLNHMCLLISLDCGASVVLIKRERASPGQPWPLRKAKQRCVQRQILASDTALLVVWSSADAWQLPVASLCPPSCHLSSKHCCRSPIRSPERQAIDSSSWMRNSLSS